MSAESEQIHQARLRAVLEDRERHRAAGESVSDISIIAAHPDLMPELGEELRKLRIIAAAREQAFAPSVHEGEPTVEHEPNQIGSRGLHIRCPHCCNPVEVITDTPYAEICCSTCGSSFSLVDREEATRMAVPLKSIGRFDLIMRLGGRRIWNSVEGSRSRVGPHSGDKDSAPRPAFVRRNRSVFS
jgi:ribosomal protein S27E